MAGSRIKGITIEIEGNTTKLQSALSGVNKDLKNTQNSLKDVNKLLKLDPTNTDLLKQKQDLLKKAIDETRQKLDTEKEALRQLKAADQTPEVISQQEALQRQIAEDENALKDLKKESSDFGSVGAQAFFAVGEKVKAVGEKVKSVGEDLTKNVTVPLAALGGASIAAFKNVDEGYDEMIKKTGATGEAAEEMIGVIDSLATTIPTDFKTAGSAVGEVNTRFGSTGDKLEQLSGAFIKFADLNNTDVSNSIDKVQKALSAYGLGADDAEAYLDRLNKTGQETGVSVDKLADGMVTNGAAFQEMGLSIDQATSFMGQLEKSGANSETVMNGMRKALKNATKEGKPLNVALSELQSTIKNGNSSMDGLNAAYDLFGKSGDQIYAAVQNGTLDFEALGAAVSDAGGSVSNTFEATQDPIDNFQKTLNQLKIVGAELGGTLLETLAPILEKVSEVLRTIKEKWDELDPGTQEMIVKALMIAAAIGPIITIVGTLITAIGALMSPIGLVVLAIGAAIAAGVALYQNWDKICEWANELKNKIVEAWNMVKEKVVGFVTDMVETVKQKWENFKQTIVNTAENIKENVTEKFEAVKSKVTEAWETLKQNTATAWSNIKQKIDENGGGIQGVIKTAMEGYKQLWQEGFNFLDELTGGKLTDIYNWFSDKFEAIKNTVSGVVDWLKGIFNFEWNLPSIKLPHFSWDWLDLGVVSLPQIYVSWYKKAYDTPYLFTEPTIVGGRGFGDGGGSGEIVYGRDQLLRDIAEASGGDEITINVYASDGMNVNELADKVSERLAFVQRQRAATYA